MRLIDPVVRPIASPASLAPRLESLDGKCIGLWANHKLNSVELLREVGAELRSRYELGGIVTGTYSSARIMASNEWNGIDDCDAVVLATGD
jgi:hypothetical protein